MNSSIAGRFFWYWILRASIPAVIRTLFLLILTLTALPNGPALGGETGSVETNEAVIRYDEPLGGVAKETAAAYPRVLRNLESRLGWRLGYRPEIRIVKDREAFAQMGAGAYAVAFAAPRRGLIVIDNSRVRTDPFSLEPILTHELAHLILHRHIPEEALPRWLDEGTAQWVSGGTAEIPLMEGTGPRLKQAVLSGRWVPFRSLAGPFPADDPALSLAYEQSRSFVEFIVRRYGSAGLLRILNGLRDGKGIDAAVEGALPVSFGELEAAWRDRLKQEVTWIVYLSNQLPVLLFLLAAVLTVLGFIRFLIRKRNYKDEDWDGEG
ncbi:MAG TPA: peptidase MA family metallohydrolase [Nitrospiria bacterium]|nr:peptidase MA family metallohydrolase [Nitrospiria bacterium]